MQECMRRDVRRVKGFVFYWGRDLFAGISLLNGQDRTATGQRSGKEERFQDGQCVPTII